MPAIPHPCFDSLAFYFDTGDSKIHARLKAGGGIILDADGLSVPDPYKRHTDEFYGSHSFVGDLIETTGLVTPGNGPATANVGVCPSIANPYDTEAIMSLTVRADLQMLGSGESAGNGRFAASVAPDGSGDFAYQVGQYEQFISSGGGGFAAQGFSSWSGAMSWVIPVGWIGTPQAVLSYQTFSGMTAGLIRCSLVECWARIHRH